MPSMSHPSSKQTIEVTPADVPLYYAAGWRKQSSSTTASPKRRGRPPKSNATASPDATTKE